MTLKISTDNIQTSTLASLASVSIPKITSITYPGDDTAATTAGGQTITLTGSGFIAGASVIVNGSYAGVVTVVSNTSITFTAPANSGGTYPLYVVNTDGGTAIAIPGISYSGTPSWSNTAGSLATVYETAALSTQLTATGDAAITYSVYSGTLPPGSSLNTSTGLLSGTTQSTASSTTYTFTIRASDAQNQDTDRAFSITINPDAVTWSSPADGTVTALFQDTAMSNVTLSATSAAGHSIAYTANALPTGVTISGSNVTGTPTVLGNTISVITATAANTNRTATRTFTWVVSVSSDPYFMNTTLLLNGEGTSANNGSNNNIFIDSSNNNYTITRNGNTSQGTFSPYSVTGWSNYFDGTGDYLSIPYSSAFNLTGDFTIEFWVNFGNLPTSTGVAPQSYQRIFSFGTYNAANSLGLEVNSNDNGQIRRWATWYNGSGASLSTNNAVDTNIWYHVAMVRSGTTITLYVNGISTGLTVTSASAAVNTSQAFYIGSLQGFESDTSACFKGYISNFRILKGTALYTTTFTPPTSPLTPITNTQLLTCQSNRFIDNSPNSLTLTKAGDVSVQAFDPFGSVPEAVPISYSTYLNGSSYVTVPSTSADSLFGSGNYTVEFWTKTDDTSWEMIAPEAGVGLALIIASGNLILQNQYGQAGILTVSASSILNNAWHHVAVVRNSGTITIYFDGTSVGTVSNSTDYSNQTLTYDIGYGNQSAGRYLTGKLSNFRIVNGTAVYTSNFTPPSTPLTNITNTKVLTFQNPTLIDNSSSARSLGVSGTQNIFIDNPFGYTGQSKTSYTPSLHGGSAYFDGTGDYLSTFAVNWSTFGSFTIEFWVYHNSMSASNQTYLSTGSTGYTNFYNYSDGRIGVGIQGTNEIATASGSIKANQWQHVTYTYNGTTTKIYVDGIMLASGTTAVYSNNSAALQIGNGLSTQPVFGYMSDVRITKGTPIYTSNFVPPTAPLTNYSTSYPAQLLLNFNNGGIIDQHGTNVLETAGDAQISTAVKKYNNSSIYLGGSGNYLQIPASTNLDFGTSDFTIECWVYNQSIAANYPTFISSITGWSSGASSHRFNNIGYSNKFWFGLNGSGGVASGDPFMASTNTFSFDTWYHYAITRSGNTWRMFVNGNLENTQTFSGSYNASLGGMRLGYATWDGANGWFKGYLDDLRITKGYARYTANFTAPAAALITK